MTLAEILAEAEELERDRRYVGLEGLIVTHGPRLLAVARAAVEMRDAVRSGKLYPDEIIAAFDDATKSP